MRAIVLAMLLVGCSSVPGWLRTDVRLVDSTWIGAQRPCGEGEGGVECRIVVEAALGSLPEGLRARIRTATLAELPAEFRTANGEVRHPRPSRGLDTYQALVLDLVDGTREVEGFLCYLARGIDGRLNTEHLECRHADLVDWRERSAIR